MEAGGVVVATWDFGLVCAREGLRTIEAGGTALDGVTGIEQDPAAYKLMIACYPAPDARHEQGADEPASRDETRKG